MDKQNLQSNTIFKDKSTENHADSVCQNSLKRHFEKKYCHELPETEIADYKNKLTRFFNLLIEIDQENKRKEAMNDDSQRDGKNQK